MQSPPDDDATSAACNEQITRTSARRIGSLFMIVTLRNNAIISKDNPPLSLDRQGWATRERRVSKSRTAYSIESLTHAITADNNWGDNKGAG